MSGTLQMEFADHTAVVAGISDQRRNKRGVIGKGFVPIATIVDSTRIHASHKAGATGRANRALTTRVSECNTVINKLVDRWRAHVGITKSTDRVKSLLVRAVPQNIRRSGHKRRIAWHIQSARFPETFFSASSPLEPSESHLRSFDGPHQCRGRSREPAHPFRQC